MNKLNFCCPAFSSFHPESRELLNPPHQSCSKFSAIKASRHKVQSQFPRYSFTSFDLRKLLSGSETVIELNFFLKRKIIANRDLWRQCYFIFRLYLLLMVGMFLFASPVSADPANHNDEPIAYIGHGAFFDNKGDQIVPTSEFVEVAQGWYKAKLYNALDAEKRNAYANVEKQLSTLQSAGQTTGQARLVVQQRSLDWLLANSTEPVDDRTRGKIRALKYALTLKLPERADLKLLETREEFKLDAALEKSLKLPAFYPDNVQILSATTNKGQAYIDECVANGVPIPPSIGVLDPAGLTGWKTQGFIPQAEQFIVGTPAEFRTFKNASGMCVALPRYSSNAKTTVSLDGVICLSKTTSKACFWDNQMNGIGFSFAAGAQIPIGVPNLAVNPAGRYQAGGFELNGGTGGVCTDCHAGENPFIIHPLANLDPGGTNLLMGDLAIAPTSLPMFSTGRYDPLVPTAWPQNQLSHSQVLVPAVCGGCHRAGGSGGRFPHLSTDLNGDDGYCKTILKQAINKTMPPGAGGSEKDNPEVIAFQAWCGEPKTSGPSDRGDPHLTTTNGVNYDFQAAGEFTALRNSATAFELQTRQTPVATTFIPGANPYTGLASCVSLNTAAALRLGKNKINFQPYGGVVAAERMQVSVNGKVVQIPARGIDLGGGNYIANAESGGGIDVKAADGTRVIITPNYWTSQGYWYLNIEVLNSPAREGTMGHITSGNWLPLAPNGKSFGPKPASLATRHIVLNQKFADAWRVTSTSSLFTYAAGTSTLDFTDRTWPPKPGLACNPAKPTRPPVKPMRPEVAQRVCGEIKDQTAYENCVFDATVTGDTGTGKAYLQTLHLRETAVP